MNGRQFLMVAQAALEESSEEWLRTAVGRAYYALFLEARDALDRWRFTAIPKYQAHAFLGSRFRYAADVDAKEIGETLFDLHRMRTWADYDNSIPFVSAFQVEQAIDRALSAVQLLDDIEADPSRLAIVLAAVRAVP